jgi:hypothetical protein
MKLAWKRRHGQPYHTAMGSGLTGSNVGRWKGWNEQRYSLRLLPEKEGILSEPSPQDPDRTAVHALESTGSAVARTSNALDTEFDTSGGEGPAPPAGRLWRVREIRQRIRLQK